MKYHELITACNKVCNGVDKSSNQITKQMCMNYIRLLIRRYLKDFKGGDNSDYLFESLRSLSLIEKYIIKIWYN